MRSKKKSFNFALLFTFILVLCPYSISAQSTEKNEKDELLGSYGACLYSYGIFTGCRIDVPFAMHSIMKFPQSIFVAECLKEKSLELHDSITVKRNQLVENTWSPMLSMFEEEKNFSYAELMQLSLTQSDNNACDILFNQFGGPKKLEEYLHKHGFTDIHIKWTERDMKLDPLRSADNNCTPKEMAQLFEWFYRKKDQDKYLNFVWNTMVNCKTGKERISSIIPEGDVFVHKTGTGFPSTDKRQDRNDAGIIIRQDGTHQIIVVFAPKSIKEDDVAAIGKKYIK